MPLYHAGQNIYITNFFALKMPCNVAHLLENVLWPVAPFLNEHTWSETITFKTQKPLSMIITVPVAKSGFCSMLYSFGFLGGWSLPSTRPTQKSTSNSPHAIMWYSFPYGKGLQGTTMKPGQVYCDNHVHMLSSMHATHKHVSFCPCCCSKCWSFDALPKIYLWMEEDWHLWSKERPGFVKASNSMT